jgi:hydrogenase nickel incorporation protein HypA/HybF
MAGSQGLASDLSLNFRQAMRTTRGHRSAPERRWLSFNVWRPVDYCEIMCQAFWRSKAAGMHEMAVTQSILDIAIKHARQAGASNIKQIHLVIGELSGVVDDSVQFYFDFLSKETIAEGAELFFDRRPAVYRCRECGTTYRPDGFDWVCPACDALTFEVISGREFRIESIEVTDRLASSENPME